MAKRRRCRDCGEQIEHPIRQIRRECLRERLCWDCFREDMPGEASSLEEDYGVPEPTEDCDLRWGLVGDDEDEND